MSKTRVYSYDPYIMESFRMGKKAGELYRDINGKRRLLGQKDVISRDTIERMYKKWVADGKPGELESIKTYDRDTGEIIVIYRDKKKGNGSV